MTNKHLSCYNKYDTGDQIYLAVLVLTGKKVCSTIGQNRTKPFIMPYDGVVRLKVLGAGCRTRASSRSLYKIGGIDGFPLGEATCVV